MSTLREAQVDGVSSDASPRVARPDAAPCLRPHDDRVQPAPARDVVLRAATPTVQDGPPAAASVPPSTPVKTLGWQRLRSEMVTAASPAPPGVITLTPFDVMCGAAFGRVLQAFFWPAAPPDAHDLLVKSLRHALSAYPTLCGRALPGGQVDTNITGVRVHLGTATATMADVLPSSPTLQLHEPINLSDFLSNGSITDVIADKSPLVTIWIAMLADGALFVGVAFEHYIADNHSMRQMLYEWAAATRAMLAGQAPAVVQLHEHSREWFDKLITGVPAPAGPVNLNGPPGSPWVRVPFKDRPTEPLPPVSAATVYVSKTRLEELKEDAHKQLKASGSAVEFVSSNDVLLARLRQVVAQLPGRGPSRPTRSRMAVEMRGRMHVAGQPDQPVCSKTAVGNRSRLIFLNELRDPTRENLGSLAATGRIALATVNELTRAEAVWAAQVEREYGLSKFDEYKVSVEYLEPFPDFGITNWDWDGAKLDFGRGPMTWMQGQFRIPEFAMVTPALHPDFAGGVFAMVFLGDGQMAAFKKLKDPI